MVTCALLALGWPGQAQAALHAAPGCQANTLPRNDDDFVQVPLGFEALMGGGFHSSVFVTNNGYVTFGLQPPPNLDYNGLRLDTTSRLIIAPFLADVDTRHPDSDVVTYGQIVFGGRPAFCVNWGSPTGNGVGYYDASAAMLNKFQLILVSRGEGRGDFDIIMNYEKVEWDQASKARLQPPQPILPTWVGHAPGRPFAVPGSGSINGEMLNGGSAPLTQTSTGSATPGTHVFEMRGGIPPLSAVIAGTLYGPDGQPAVGAAVQLCRTPTGSPCFFATTGSQGHYVVSINDDALNGWPFALTASAPPEKTWLFPEVPIEVTPVSGQVLDGYDVLFDSPQGLPSGTVLSPSRPSGIPDMPAVFWQDPLQLVTGGCPGALEARYAVYQGGLPPAGTIISSGTLNESAAIPGLYEAVVPSLHPNHGQALVVTTLVCPDGVTETGSFNIYIDPSGDVINTHGRFVIGAKVTLFRSEYPTGPFEIVPDGSTIMSPANRVNPMLSDGRGHFGWDTIAGYYKVQAEKPGCVSAEDPSRPYAETGVLPVPPPVTDLLLRLDCGAVPPPTISAPARVDVETAGPSGTVVTYEASAVDGTDGPVEVQCLPASGARFPVGTTPVTCTAINSYGNVATYSFPVTVANPRPPALTLCNLPRYTRETHLKACGWATAGNGGTAVTSVFLSVDGGAPLPLSSQDSGGYVSTFLDLDEGTHVIELTAVNAHGGFEQARGTVTVDLTPPVLTVLSPGVEEVLSSTVVDVTSQVRDATPVEVVTQWSQSSRVESGAGTVTHRVDLVNPGLASLLVFARDAAGNTTEVRLDVWVEDGAVFPLARPVP